MNADGSRIFEFAVARFVRTGVAAALLASAVGAACCAQEVEPELQFVRTAPEEPAVAESETVPTTPRAEPIPPPEDTTAALGLDEVRGSVQRYYPLLVAAVQERGIAEGEQISSRGVYDLRASAENITGALGFYRTNRAAIGFERYTLPGGKISSGYRIGRGSFEPWYLERQTNEGGEFKLGYQQSLLQGLAIDKRRVGLRKADLARAAAEPSIDKQRIYFLEYAAIDYWKWVAAGHWYVVNRDLLRLAEMRVEGIDTRINRGILPEIERLDNRRLIVSRQTKLIEADRKFQQAAVELSLYLRDEFGSPTLPASERLPSFPVPTRPDEARLEDDLATALTYRPEPRYLRLQREKTVVELNFARNQTLPQLDAVVGASKDVGLPTSPKNDKGPFQLEAGLLFDVPIQRRDAGGRIRSAEAALTQIRAQEQFAADRVRADVRYALAGLKTAYEEYAYAVESADLASRMEAAERTKFDLGNSNILMVNLREQATADARITMIDALAEYHIAEAEYRAALGLDAGFAAAP